MSHSGIGEQGSLKRAPHHHRLDLFVDDTIRVRKRAAIELEPHPTVVETVQDEEEDEENTEVFSEMEDEDELETDDKQESDDTTCESDTVRIR